MQTDAQSLGTVNPDLNSDSQFTLLPVQAQHALNYSWRVVYKMCTREDGRCERSYDKERNHLYANMLGLCWVTLCAGSAMRLLTHMYHEVRSEKVSGYTMLSIYGQ